MSSRCVGQRYRALPCASSSSLFPGLALTRALHCKVAATGVHVAATVDPGELQAFGA